MSKKKESLMLSMSLLSVLGIASEGCKQRAYNSDTASSGGEGSAFSRKYKASDIRYMMKAQKLPYSQSSKCYAKNLYNKGGYYPKKLNEWVMKGKAKALRSRENCSGSKCEAANYFNYYLKSGYGYCDAEAIGQYISGKDPIFYAKYGTKYGTVHQGKLYIGMKWYRKLTSNEPQRSDFSAALTGVRDRATAQTARSEFCQQQANSDAMRIYSKNFGYCDAEAVARHMVNGREVSPTYISGKKLYIGMEAVNQGFGAARSLVDQARAHVAQMAKEGKLQGQTFCQFKDPESCAL